MEGGTVADTAELTTTLLAATDEAYREARRRRAQAATAAREAGLTNQAIADAYGITEGAVRSLIKRANPTRED